MVRWCFTSLFLGNYFGAGPESNYLGFVSYKELFTSALVAFKQINTVAFNKIFIKTNGWLNLDHGLLDGSCSKEPEFTYFEVLRD